MLRILLPVDGSEFSMRTVRHAIGLQAAFSEKLEVLLLTVAPAIPATALLLEGLPSEINKLEMPARAHGAEVQAAARAALDNSGIRYEAHVEIGETAPVIAAFATTHHCRMIVMGRRGLGGIAGIILGSVVQKVLHLSPVPVVVVP